MGFIGAFSRLKIDRQARIDKYGSFTLASKCTLVRFAFAGTVDRDPVVEYRLAEVMADHGMSAFVICRCFEQIGIVRLRTRSDRTFATSLANRAVLTPVHIFGAKSPILGRVLVAVMCRARAG
jgi:hypothetical protein